MRDTKFEVWDAEFKKLFSWEELLEMKIELGSFFSNEQLVRRQYTGLKDKNGREIYEGDIIRMLEVMNEGESNYVTDIRWEDGSFIMKSGGNDYDTFLASWFGDPMKTYPLFEMEVIGNIYEDTQLLAGDSN